MLIRVADGPTSAVIRTLMVVYQRVTGHTGPGAGRPAKLYRRRISIWPYRCPSVATIWPCGCLSSAREHAERSGDSPRAVLDQRAYQLGQELGDTARKAHGGRDTRDTALRVLQQYGFEPRIESDDVTLANCPFHTLAQEYTKLVCGMNIRLLAGLLDGLARTGLTAHLDPPHPDAASA
jgi:predicted ArsR family transcriptional regulator